MSAKHQASIFVSYRREDSSGYVLGLVDRLRREFGESAVFTDVHQWETGDFRELISEAVASCEVLIAVVGRNWLTAKDSRGEVRIKNQNDFVRAEIAAGLARDDVTLLPVLVNGATMPAPDDLPEDIRDFSYQNALELRDVSWDTDVERLVRTLKNVLGHPSGVTGPGWGGKKYAAAAAYGAALLLVGALTYMALAGKGADPIENNVNYSGRETPPPPSQTPVVQTPPPTPTPTPSPTPGEVVLVGTEWSGTGDLGGGVLENLKVEFVNSTFCQLDVVSQDRASMSLPRCNYTVAGDRITIKAVKPYSRIGPVVEITYSGKLSGDSIEGTATNTAGMSWRWKARKDR